MVSVCGCKPGNLDNGWHEKRSAVCNQKERQDFHKVMETAAKLIAVNKKK